MDKKKILDILANILEIEKERLVEMPMDTRLADLGMESIQFIQFIVALEEAFDIEVLDSDLLMTNFETIEMLYQTMEKYFAPNMILKKVLICDCDNVLWHGVSGEEEIYTDNLTNAFQEAAVELYDRGVLLCLCSKNEPGNIKTAFDTLQMPLRESHILISKVNMVDKATNIKEIALELNLSADSFVFVDDSEYELDLVSAIIPEITTIRADYLTNDFIEQVQSLFASNTTDINRTQQYREQKEREKDKKSFATADEFNASLKTEVRCELATITQAPRISELSQRTNQFNLSDAHYSENEISDFITNDHYCVYALSACDKYGDMGIVGAAILHKSDKPVILAFFLSCRVFGRKFEEQLINKIKGDFSTPLKGLYKKTDKNKRFETFYLENGVEVNE